MCVFYIKKVDYFYLNFSFGFSRKRRLDIPVHLVPAPCISNVCMNALIQLPRFLCQEEQLAYQMTNQVPLDYLTRLHNSSGNSSYHNFLV